MQIAQLQSSLLEYSVVVLGQQIGGDLVSSSLHWPPSAGSELAVSPQPYSNLTSVCMDRQTTPTQSQGCEVQAKIIAGETTSEDEWRDRLQLSQSLLGVFGDLEKRIDVHLSSKKADLYISYKRFLLSMQSELKEMKGRDDMERVKAIREQTMGSLRMAFELLRAECI